MHIHSDSFQHGQRLPAQFAAGQRNPDGSVGFAANRNPQLAWDDVPAGTQSFALLCIDPDVPTVAAMVGRDDVQIPVAQPRTDFIQWVMVDIGADVRRIAAGSCSDGVVAHGKAAPAGPAGARQGRNDYTGWFASDPAMAGDWHGYDGPFPPPNDLRLHRYFFRLFALDVAALDVAAADTAGDGGGRGAMAAGAFSGSDVLRAMHGHVLGEASTYATYSLNRAVAD